MPARKTTSRKTATKRKTPTRRTSSASRTRSTASKSRSATKSRTASKSRSRSRSACGSRSSCGSVCRSPYMKNEVGACGPVACVDETTGRPLLGYTRNSQGVCAPKKCGRGYVFNYLTGNCVSTSSYEGQELLKVKRHNDAYQARINAQRIIDTPIEFKDDKTRASFKSMLGGYDRVADAQASYQTDLNNFRKERQKLFQAELVKAQERRSQSASRCHPSSHRPCATQSTPYSWAYNH